MIEVGDGCSPIRDAALSFYSIIVLYLCCKMKSKLRLATIVLITFVITFLINSIRISILAFVVSKNQMAYFDFLHTGGGSLFFSFCIILGCSFSYYLLWCSENPKKEFT